MKRRNFISYICFCLMALPFIFCSCKQKDNIEEIFTGKVWHWSGSYRTNNWQHDNNAALTLSREELGKINDSQDFYNITFKEDGSLEGRGERISFTGEWSADGKDHSFYIKLNHPGDDVGLGRQFIKEIQSAKFYRGDSRFIKLFNQDKNYFIQFYPQGFKK